MPRLATLFCLLAVVAGAQYTPPNPQWNRPIEPFRLVGNVYYVGASGVSSFLITTTEGHILLDTGFAETAPIVETGIRKLGFRVEDVRLLLASHAYYDYAGGMAAMKAKTKARLLMNAREVKLFERGGSAKAAAAMMLSSPAV